MIAARVLVNISDLLVMNSKVIAPITKEIAKDDAKWTMNQSQIQKSMTAVGLHCDAFF